jgi:serine/threonine protein kinase
MTQSQSSQFSKYRIIGLVGRGQFGRVLCARHRETKNLVALKELEAKRFPTHQLLRELRFLISLQHPNIVSCLSLVHGKKCRYLVMEYCASGTLRELIEHHAQLTPQQCIFLTIDILLGLEHAHSENIIHCDLKPENVLLTLKAEGWQAKLSDFGIARLSQEIAEEGSAGNTGSPGYMAPERFYGQFSIASDIYAVGIMLYELLFKERPFTGKPSELMSAHMNQRVIMPASVPRSLQEIMLKALQKLPARRYIRASEMLADLEAIAHSSEITNLALAPISNLAPLLPISLAKNPDLLHWLDLPKGKDPSNPIVAIAALFAPANSTSSLTQLYSIWIASATQVQKLAQSPQDPFFKQEEILVPKFNSKILTIAAFAESRTAAATILVITQTQIYRQIQAKWQPIYQIIPASTEPHPNSPSQKFLWAISPKADWIAVAIANSLEIKNLKYLRTMRLGFNQSQINFIVAIDQHHLVAISNQTKTQDSRLWVISRRGNVMRKVTLPAQIAMAIAGQPSNRLLLVEAKNRTILLIDLAPYHIIRIVLAHQPILVATTTWGYAIASIYEDHGITQGSGDRPTIPKSVITLIDGYGQNLGSLDLDGEILAIAAIDVHSLAISVTQGDQSRLCVIDLRELEIDLIF